MNPFLASVASLLIGGGLVYFIQSRIRVKEAHDIAGIQAEAVAVNTPYQVLQQQLNVKDSQIAQSQAVHHSFVESQMARNDATTKATLELAEQVRAQTENLKDMSRSLQSHREESSARTGKIYEKIGEVNERLATIEAQMRSA